MNEQTRTQLMHQIAENAVSDGLDLWPEIQARLEVEANRRSGEASGPERPDPRPLPGRWHGIVVSRRPLLGLASAAILALAIGATLPLWNHPDAVSAQEILDRAEATASGSPVAVTTYHLQQVRRVPGKGGATITTEVWFGGSSRQRSESRIADGTGAVSSSGVIFDGAQTWIHHAEKGQTQVIHTVGTTWTNPVDDPSKHTSLSDVLAQYGNDKSCLTARHVGEESVDNRPSYVIAVTPRADGCGRDLGATARKVVGPGAGGDDSVGQMTIWVDQQTFLPLRTEVRNPTGVVLDESQVTDLQYNVPIPDSTFSYTPPAGVAVYNFTGGDGGQVKKAIFTGQATPQAK
jgi:outer membrane lipoprotein-sorting protein